MLCAAWGAAAMAPAGARSNTIIFLRREGGIVLNPPGAAMIPLRRTHQRTTLHHPDGMLTSFPCNSGRVKVTRLSPDGWARRHILGIMLHDDNRIVAFFSDGKQEAIAIAAPSSNTPPAPRKREWCGRADRAVKAHCRLPQKPLNYRALHMAHGQGFDV